MKKTYNIEVDCANCANKMETLASKVEGVASVAISFMMQKMTVEFADGSNEKLVLREIVKRCRRVDGDFELNA